ncbi:glycosyltransferase family 2 protein [Pseudomonadota bacterium]
MTELKIVVPCYNEEEVLPGTSKILQLILEGLIKKKKISNKSSIVFIDDGSSDGTWEIIESLSSDSKHINGIKLSCNRGHQNALLAGLLNVSGDVVVSIDADLQDDENSIEDMVDAYHQGYDVVYGVRGTRASDNPLKRITAELYYKMLKLMGVNVVYNHADYRLISRRVINALEEYQEVNVFLRGLIPSIGFSSTVITYERKERFAGESKYPFRKMLSLALNGVTSFTSFPLRLIAILGLLILSVTIMLSIWALWVSIYDESAVPGWASSVLPMYLLGGIQLFSIGVIGEYIGKIYMETKERPRFIIEKSI